MNVAYTLGRVLLPLVFLVAGAQKALNIVDFAKLVAATGIPIPDQIEAYLRGLPKYEALGYLIAVVEVICALMVMIGFKARWGALVLAVFSACAIIFVHHFWDMQGDALIQNRDDALKNLSIMGGLLLIVAVGAGPSLVDDR